MKYLGYHAIHKIFDHSECHWFNVNVDITSTYKNMLPREDYLFCWVLKKSWSWDPTAYLWGEITAHKTQGFITVICFVKTSPLCLYVTVFITQTFHLVTMEISLLTLPRVFCKLHIFIKLELGKEFDDWCLRLWRMVGLTKIWCWVGICKHLVRYYWGGGFLQQQKPTGLSVRSCPIRPSHWCRCPHALFVGSWQNNSLCWQKPYLLMDW